MPTDEDGPDARDLLTLSAAARRIADLVAAAEQPLRYEVMRHLVRVSEETMTEVLDEAVHAKLVRRGDDPFTYVPYNERVGADIRGAMPEERLRALRARIRGATESVSE